MALNFFTCANKAFELYIAPYIASGLIANTDSHCEILVESPERFQDRHARALSVLRHHFSDQWLIRPMDRRYWSVPMRVMWNTQRFFSIPTVRMSHTYIADVDILILDKNIEQAHTAHCEALGLPYSNIVRAEPRRLGGFHFVRTEPYFDTVNSQYVSEFVARSRCHFQKWTDEHILYEMMSETFGIPQHSDRRVANFRPDHGFHLSRHRAPTGQPGWGVVRSRAAQYASLKQDERWNAVVEQCDEEYQALLRRLEGVIEQQGFATGLSPARSGSRTKG